MSLRDPNDPIEDQALVGAYKQCRSELAAIEARNYSQPLDYTRAAIARASIRSIEMDILNDLARQRLQQIGKS
jgi:hypothetical protein